MRQQSIANARRVITKQRFRPGMTGRFGGIPANERLELELYILGHVLYALAQSMNQRLYLLSTSTQRRSAS